MGKLNWWGERFTAHAVEVGKMEQQTLGEDGKRERIREMGR